MKKEKMPGFYYVRVELRNKDSAGFSQLQEAMIRQGFSVTVDSSGGSTYKLPCGMFCIRHSNDKWYIHNLAKEAAKSAGKDVWILTIKADGAALDLEDIRDEGVA
ncbi:hypothetical protein [Spirosoma sp. 48-14]|uniref:hypothetical protein n=1 Tax=Spirosoma sp. 48-14 TaxID=1895854 RepID=UPI0025CF0428|nr:hypothetical protein [Spirosoma sp. 48-14]